jgi:hypothetical protein
MLEIIYGGISLRFHTRDATESASLCPNDSLFQPELTTPIARIASVCDPATPPDVATPWLGLARRGRVGVLSAADRLVNFFAILTGTLPGRPARPQS